MGIKTRRDLYGVYTNVNTKEIYRTSKLLSAIVGASIPSNKAIAGRNAFKHEAGIHQHGVLANKKTYEIITPESVGLNVNNIVLGKHSGRHAVAKRRDALVRLEAALMAGVVQLADLVIDRIELGLLLADLVLDFRDFRRLLGRLGDSVDALAEFIEKSHCVHSF